MGNIFATSNSPVEIKKINLHVWKLRSEIESRLRNGPVSEREDDLAKVIELYKFRETVFEDESKEEEKQTSGEENDHTDENDEQANDENQDELKAQEGVENQSDHEIEQLHKQSNSTPQGHEMILSYIHPDDHDMAQGVCILSDINMMDICFFSNQAFIIGQTIVLEFIIPRKFCVTAQILSCKNYHLESRIISERRPPYRLHAKLIFLKEGERTLLRQFVGSIEPDTIQVNSKKSTASKSSEDDDEFGDLDDLGL